MPFLLGFCGGGFGFWGRLLLNCSFTFRYILYYQTYYRLLSNCITIGMVVVFNTPLFALFFV